MDQLPRLIRRAAQSRYLLQTWNASGTKVAETMTTYDSTSLTSITGVTQHDDTDFGTANTVRGNPTVVKSWTGGSSYLSTTNTYDMTGQLLSTTDPAGNVTQMAYTDNYYTQPQYGMPTPYSPAPPTTNAFATQKTLPVSGTLHYGYYYLNGKQALYTDQNGQTATTYYQDPLDRPTLTYMPAGGAIVGSYPSANQVDYSTATFSGSSTLDSLARPDQSCNTGDPQGTSCGTIAYDSSGRKYQVNNPQRSGDTSTPAGTITYYYDGMNRVTQLVATVSAFLTVGFFPVFCRCYVASASAQGERPQVLCLGEPAPVVGPVHGSGVFLDRWEPRRDATAAGFWALLCGYVLMPDHWHALLWPQAPLTISRVLHDVKLFSARRVNALRERQGPLWQHQFWDRFVRQQREYSGRLNYMHNNPVRKGLVAKPEDWRWSSFGNFSLNASVRAACPIQIDYVELPESYRG